MSITLNKDIFLTCGKSKSNLTGFEKSVKFMAMVFIANYWTQS